MILVLSVLFAGCQTGLDKAGLNEAGMGAQSLGVTSQSLESKAVSKVFETTETFIFEGFSAPAWTSETFNGRHARRIVDGVLEFEMSQSHPEGGLDVGLSQTDFLARPVAQISKDTEFCSSYDIALTGTGRWWAGPKISVNWQGDEAAKQNGNDWYENYIVEIASSSPTDLHNIFTGDYFKGELIDETMIAGASYKHYKIRFHNWWQFWSIRQSYRETGQVPIKTILDIWSENGLPEFRQFDGVKANIETYGPLIGKGRLKSLVSEQADTLLNCTL